MNESKYVAYIPLAPVGKILHNKEHYWLADFYLAGPPTSEELCSLNAEGCSGMVLAIEVDGSDDDFGCYLSLIMPLYDFEDQPTSMSVLKWRTLVQFSLPIPCIDILIETLRGIQQRYHTREGVASRCAQ